MQRLWCGRRVDMGSSFHRSQEREHRAQALERTHAAQVSAETRRNRLTVKGRADLEMTVENEIELPGMDDDQINSCRTHT